ncbi:MAG: hypothetical protein JWO95_307, partial [Verrucomicrobiales bacterium]|nr:hypothetical protein [Verrucomicrobiales bacterium]
MKLLTIAVGTLIWVASASAQPEVARITSNRLQIGVDTSRGTLVEFTDLQSSFNQLADAQSAPALWKITIHEGDNVQELSPETQPAPTIEQLQGNSPTLHLVWNKFTNAPHLSRIDVVVKFDEQNTALSRWDISITKTRSLRLEQIQFPRTGSLRQRTNECLAVPKQLGLLTHNARALVERSGRRITWHSPHGTDLSLPCVAFYQPSGPCFYAACDDAEGYLKDLAIWTDGKDHLNFEITHQPEQGAIGETNFHLPFTTVLGTFRGDWTTAAEMYRESPTAKKFAAEGLRRQQLAPAWIRETGLWLWNRGRSQQVLDPAIALRNHIDAPVSVLWHWWHNCAYDAGFPEFLPPREGSAAFKTAIAAAKRRDVHAILYMNQRLWGTNTASWRDENAQIAAIKSVDSKVVTESYNKFTNAPCAPMCIATHQWRAKYAGLADDVLCDLKADGIYMDQAGVLANCYDATHGHIVGPGRYWSDGFTALTTEIRDRTSTRGPVALGCEYGGEPWLGQFDLTLGLCVSHDRIGTQADWEPIPFFQAVYHPSSTVFGNLTGLAYPPYDEKWPSETAPATAMSLLDRKFSKQLYLDQARTFVWGMQPMLANFLPEQLKARPEELDYVTRLVHTRMRALKYLAQGTWVRPPKLDVPEQEI